MARQDRFEVVEHKHSGLTERDFAEQHQLSQLLPIRVVNGQPSFATSIELELREGAQRRFTTGTNSEGDPISWTGDNYQNRLPFAICLSNK